jgi:hypothetical protein
MKRRADVPRSIGSDADRPYRVDVQAGAQFKARQILCWTALRIEGGPGVGATHLVKILLRARRTGLGTEDGGEKQ